MLNQFFMGVRRHCILLILLLLAGCAGTSVVSKSESQVPAYKLNSTQVIWTDNYSMPYEITSIVKTYRPLYNADNTSLISDADKVKAGLVIGQLLSSFRAQVVPKVRARFAENNVHDGNEATLELIPVLAHYVASGGRRIEVRASIKRGLDSREVWSEIIETHGPKEDANEILLDNFVNALTDELKKAGWLAK